MVSDTSCCPGYSYAMISLGDTWDEIYEILGEPSERNFIGADFFFVEYKTLFGGFLMLLFKYSYSDGDYILVGVQGLNSEKYPYYFAKIGYFPGDYSMNCLGIPTGRLKREKGMWYYETYVAGERRWIRM